MRPNLLILGGTREANDLATAVVGTKIRAVYSYAGRVDTPREQPVPTRIGGFGGPEGLAAYISDNDITHVIDATHPFAAQMSRNAAQACARAKVPLMAFGRPPWSERAGDAWQHVPDMIAAIESLEGPPKRIFLAIGRTEIAGFAAQPQHHYLLRLVDAPSAAPPLTNCTVVVDRGPFNVTADTELLRSHDIELVVSKNSGGSGARAKIDAARALGVPVLMIDRPPVPHRDEAGTLDEVLEWIERSHDGTLRGV